MKSSSNSENEKVLVEKYADLELKLAFCLQHHRLASFKPSIIALALISLELEKQQAQQPELNIDWLASISYLQRLAKVRSSCPLLAVIERLDWVRRERTFSTNLRF